MSRIHEVIARYEACRSVCEQGIDVLVIGDPAGDRFHRAIRKAVRQIDDSNLDVWQAFISAARAVRWRRMMQPQPRDFVTGLDEMVCRLSAEAEKLRGLVNDVSAVDDVVSTARELADDDPLTGQVLQRLVGEAGPRSSVVIAGNIGARSGLSDWLEPLGVKVLVASEFDRIGPEIKHTFAVGAPALYPASIVTAPATAKITFLMPSWFADRSVPASKLSEFAEGGVCVSARVREIGIDPATEMTPYTSDDEVDPFLPSPLWNARQKERREPKSDEVEAWKLLLGGGLALWLDDGERIRSLDPRQPAGDRISYEAVSDVREGTYLVLREGATERGAMYEAALASMGPHAESIAATQQLWKQALTKSIEKLGIRRVITELEQRGVGAATRITAWIEPTLICPRREENLAILLDWLGIPREPTYSNALALRRALYRAIAELRQELEEAVAQADMSTLERDAFIRLNLEREGFRSMLVTRVLARSPFTEIVHRNQARVPFPDEGALWLE
jgi:hypothetical protein